MSKQWKMAIGFFVMLLSQGVMAHSITVDGVATEWLTRGANADNMGIIARDANEEGEYIWRDATDDERTDLVGSGNHDLELDIIKVQISGQRLAGQEGLAIFVKTASPPTATAQVQIGIDMDQISGSGQAWFVGFADTKTQDDARWEYLVQTRFATGEQAAVINQTFNVVATVSATEGVDGFEIVVPWSALGLSGPPSTPLRFTIATFRSNSGNNDVVNIGDDTNPNAIDVMSDYGDPRTSAYPNTWKDFETGDQTINYFAEVYFKSSGDPLAGEVYSPILIDRLVSNLSLANGGEWIVLRNVSPTDLLLSNFKLGDEETADGSGEFMGFFPAGMTLPAGQTLVVAQSATYFLSAYGHSPDAEFPPTGTNPDDTNVPNLASFTVWSAGGSWGLGNSGDEALVLDPSNTLLDLVGYGSPSTPYPGITYFSPAPGANQVLHRVTASRDSDDCSQDFALSAACASDASCNGGTVNLCKPCELNTCTQLPNGASCADGQICNGDETCDGAGVCQASAPAGEFTPCPDGDLCNGDEQCDGIGGCQPGSPMVCDDSDACNGVETCDPFSGCQTGTPPVCEDNNPCTADTCDSLIGCVNTGLPGISCSDGNVCNGEELCDGAGVCQPGTSLICDDSDACNGVETCDPTSGCMLGTPLVCDDSNPCTDDSCEAATGCMYLPNPTSSCADADLCNGDETCDANGNCVPGQPIQCPPSQDPCQINTCELSSGSCQLTPADVATPCPDGDLCNGDEACDGNGVCLPGTPVSCEPSQDPCQVNQCNQATGQCGLIPAGEGTPCSDNDACNGEETCDGNGNCLPGTPLDCDDHDVCTQDDCVNSACVHTINKDSDQDNYIDTQCPNGTDCDDNNPNVNPGVSEAGAGSEVCTDQIDNDCDGLTDLQEPACGGCTIDDDCRDNNICNGLETCHDSQCVGGETLNCDDGNACTIDSCNLVSGCQWENSSAPCDDGNACTAEDVCSNGACVPGQAVACDDHNPCTDDACDTLTGCVYANNTLACSDGNACTQGDVCLAGSCVPGAGVSCDDGNLCTDDSCDTGTGCRHVNNTNACSDQSACTVGDSCVNGACAPGPALDCDDGNACTDDSCDPDIGCVHQNSSAACDDGNACTSNDKCAKGTCSGTAINCSYLDNACSQGVCNSASGECRLVPKENGTSCDDGESCTENDICQDGVCAPGSDTCVSGGGCGCITDSSGDANLGFNTGWWLLLGLGVFLGRRLHRGD